MTDFGKVLRARRRQRMMTLRQLSERTKLSVSLLSEIERGVAQPSMASLKKISHAMGFGLFDFSEEPADLRGRYATARTSVRPGEPS